MGNLLNKTKSFFKHNSSTILTCVGALGVVGTAVATAIATPKALALLEKSKEEKGEELTKFEKVKTVAPAYIPAVTIGVSTIACIFGANALNKRQQASLMSAYAVLDTSYKNYKKRTSELFAADEDTIIHRAAESQYSEKDILEANDGRQLFFDFNSLQFFRSTMDEVIAAENYVNDTLESRGYVLLGEFYDKLGIITTDYDYQVGWSKAAGSFLYGYDSIQFDHYHTTMDNGEKCCSIRMPFEPTSDTL